MPMMCLSVFQSRGLAAAHVLGWLQGARIPAMAVVIGESGASAVVPEHTIVRQ